MTGARSLAIRARRQHSTEQCLCLTLVNTKQLRVREAALHAAAAAPREWSSSSSECR